MRALGLHRKSKDYLNTLNIDTHYFEERFIPIETLIKANRKRPLNTPYEFIL